MGEPTVAEILLARAEQDALAYRKLAGDAQIHDVLIGFHAQQAVEKSIKAILAHGGIAFRRTHDIAELLDLLADSSLPSPPHADRLDELNPYAVELRYGLIEPGKLDRAGTQKMLDAVLEWARATIFRF